MPLNYLHPTTMQVGVAPVRPHFLVHKEYGLVFVAPKKLKNGLFSSKGQAFRLKKCHFSPNNAFSMQKPHWDIHACSLLTLALSPIQSGSI